MMSFIIGVITTLAILFLFGRIRLKSGRPVLDRRISRGPYIMAVASQCKRLAEDWPLDSMREQEAQL